MKKFLFLVVLICVEKSLHAQAPSIYTITADSVKITNDCDTAELIIENHTQNVPGFLYNKGRGRTEFRKATKLDDSTIVLGGDTIVIQGAVPPLQKVLIAGSHLNQDNEITMDENMTLGLIANGSYGLSYIGSRYTDNETHVMAGNLATEMSVADNNEGLRSGITIMPGEYPGIWVNDDFHQLGFYYGGDYTPTGIQDRVWIPHLGAVRKEISDSISLMRDIRLQVRRTPVNNTGYTADPSDNLIAFTSLTAPRTVTLPDASLMTNKVMVVKDESGAAGTHNITVNVTAGGTIDGVSSKVVSAAYGSIEVYSNGSKWFTK